MFVVIPSCRFLFVCGCLLLLLLLLFVVPSVGLVLLLHSIVSSVVVVTCFHSDRYHPAYCTSVASSSLVARRKRLVDDVDVEDFLMT